jgi:hypothetical protein
MYVHALHTVHALPDLRVAGGRLGDGVSLSLKRAAAGMETHGGAVSKHPGGFYRRNFNGTLRMIESVGLIAIR